MSVLTSAAGLPDILALGLNVVFADSFPISNLWLADVGFNGKFTLHTINNYLKVKLAHSGDNRLASLVVQSNAKCWVFFGQSLQGSAHLFLVGLGFGFNSNTYWRFRKGYTLQNYWM